MKINKKEIIIISVVILMAILCGIITTAGIVTGKTKADIGPIALFGMLTLICILASICLFFFTDWYMKIEEIPLNEFQQYKFINKYILAKDNIAFDIPIEIMDFIDLSIVKIRHSYDYKKRLKKVELNLLDQNRK